MHKISHSRSALSTIQDSLFNNNNELLTARSEYERFWAKYHGDEAFTVQPHKAFNIKERL